MSCWIFFYVIISYACSVSAAEEDGTQSSASDRYMSTCSTETEPDGGAREEKQGKINEGSTGCWSSYEGSDDPQALSRDFATVGASLPIIDETDTNRKRKSATEGNVSLDLSGNKTT